jgi:uncharacterized protein YrrD
MLKKMELNEGVGVFTLDGEEVGKIKRFVLNPATNEVTHLVVQKGWLRPDEKVVPMQMVSYGTEEKIVLTRGVDDFNQLPSFEEKHFIKVTDEDVERMERSGEYSPSTIFPAYYSYPPQGYGGYGGYPAPGLEAYLWPPVETSRNIPEDTVPLKEGTNVISSNGEHVGDVERLFIDSDSNKATHFVITQGFLFKERKLIPVQWVDTVGEKEVHLLVSSELLGRLPAYKS